MARPSIWYLLHFSYIKRHPELQQSEKHIRAKHPVKLPKAARKITALSYPNVHKGQLLRTNVSSTRPKQTSKAQFLNNQFFGVTQPGTLENHGSVLVFTTKAQKQKLRIDDGFLFLHLRLFQGPKLGQSARGPHHRAAKGGLRALQRAAKGGLRDLGVTK